MTSLWADTWMPQAPGFEVAFEGFHEYYWQKKVSLPCDCDLARRGGSRSPLSRAIQHLNDSHEWTYLKIADWLDTVDVKPLRKLS